MEKSPRTKATEPRRAPRAAALCLCLFGLLSVHCGDDDEAPGGKGGAGEVALVRARAATSRERRAVTRKQGKEAASVASSREKAATEGRRVGADTELLRPTMKVATQAPTRLKAETEATVAAVWAVQE